VKRLQLGAVTARAQMIKLTATQEITPYQWVHPDEESGKLKAFSFLEPTERTQPGTRWLRPAGSRAVLSCFDQWWDGVTICGSAVTKLLFLRRNLAFRFTPDVTSP
jgi:hypothetical protein